jgi:mannitol-specific phosphotransferase system IIBC component
VILFDGCCVIVTICVKFCHLVIKTKKKQKKNKKKNKKKQKKKKKKKEKKFFFLVNIKN